MREKGEAIRNSAVKRESKCCTLHIVGHRGTLKDPGGAATYPYEGADPVFVLPNPDLEAQIRQAFADNGSFDSPGGAQIVRWTCGGLGKPDAIPGETPQAQMQRRMSELAKQINVADQIHHNLAISTGCTVSGTVVDVTFSTNYFSTE